jgi:predicted lipoprotein with Yx(FWY)xxD motif
VTRITYALFALLATAIVLAIAGCGGSDSGSSGGAYGGSETSSGSGGAGGGYSYGGGSSQKSASSEGGSGAANVSLASVEDLGMILVDSNGMTLYDFHKDKGTESMCDGACAEAWPPLLTEGTPTAGNGADESLLGTTTRSDGTEQVTYAGHPVYTFTGDKKPGEATGNDIDAFGAEWYALKANGEEP